MNIHDYEVERGHSLMPEAEVLAMIPRLYETDGTDKEEKLAYVHYFVGGCDWYLMELNQDEDEWLAFGWCDLGQGCRELGYFSLHELGSIQANGRVRFINDSGETVEEGIMPIYVERDLGFKPTPWAEVQP